MKALRCGTHHGKSPRKNPCSGYIFEAIVSLVEQMPEVFVNAQVDAQAFAVYSSIYIIRVDRNTGAVSVTRVAPPEPPMDTTPELGASDSPQTEPKVPDNSESETSSTRKSKPPAKDRSKNNEAAKTNTDTQAKQEVEVKVGLEQLG